MTFASQQSGRRRPHPGDRRGKAAQGPSFAAEQRGAPAHPV